jgi:type I restriction enzyme R subunit
LNGFNESVVEQAALAWMESVGWRIAQDPDIAPDMPAAERRDYGEVVLAQRLRDALARLNPALPSPTTRSRTLSESSPGPKGWT